MGEVTSQSLGLAASRLKNLLGFTHVKAAAEALTAAADEIERLKYEVDLLQRAVSVAHKRTTRLTGGWWWFTDNAAISPHQAEAIEVAAAKYPKENP